MKYTDEEIIFKYIDNDYRLTKTAGDLNLGYTTVKNVLDLHGIEIKRYSGMTSIDVGSKVGMLTLIERLPNKHYPSGSQDRMFLCNCDCGGQAVVPGAELRREKKTNCGCKNKTGVVKSMYTPENYKELLNVIDNVEKPKTIKNLTPVMVNTSNLKCHHYKIGDKKDKLTILMRKQGIGPTVDYIDKFDELFVECDCGEYKKMTYEEFMNSTTCGCDNNG
jgi:hypothetical protein